MGCSNSKPKHGATGKVVDSGAEPSTRVQKVASAGAGDKESKEESSASPYHCTTTLREHGYELAERLGEGGFGEVHAVTKDVDGVSRRFACKMISKLLVSTEKESASLALETTLMNRVRGHPNVVELAESFEDKRYYFLVMDVCDGGELMTRIVEHTHFSERTAASFFRQMLLGVQHCHKNGVVHRDLKPENFLFDGKGEDANLKLTDFGLGYGISSPDEVITEACGSAYYIAPEVFTRRFTKACDIWSMGVILYLLLGGTVPFGYMAKEENDVYTAIQKEPMRMDATEHQRAVWPKISPAARELVHGLLEKDPLKRYTLEQALSHPWVHGEAAKDEPLDVTVIKSMTTFTARNKFKKEALKMIASTLSAADVQALRENFHRIDADNTGTITLKELQQAVTHSDSMPDIDRDRISALYRELDTDGDGIVNYEEFLTATTERQLVNHQNNIWWAFCEYDRDGNGMISESELMKIMKDTPPDQIRKYISEFDIDADGMINYEEFMRMVLPKDLKYRISRYS